MSLHSDAMNAIDLRPHILTCGYNESQLARDVEIDSGQRVPLIAFAHSPHDSRSSCLAVIDNVMDPEIAVASARPIAAPLVFASYGKQWQLWRQGADKPRLIEAIAPGNLENFFAQHRGSLAPDSVYRAKTWARFDKSYQLALVDVGLMPLIEEEAGRKLSSLIERTVIETKRRLGWDVIADDQGHWLLKSNFWLLAGKILRDKRVGAFIGLDLEDLDNVFGLVAHHYGAIAKVPVGSAFQAEALRQSARDISNFSSLELLTIEALAYLYENALITKTTRTELETHSTPAYLVDYIVGKLRPWIEELPVDERHTFEPACGHAAFLIAGMRLLSDLLPANTSPVDRHDYLRDRLHGCDIDTFALEIARLSLTLSDVPNPNGWDLQPMDMFQADMLARCSQTARIVLANPPFNVAASVLDLVANNLQPGSMFGVVLPQTLLQTKKATSLRELIAKNFEIAEVDLFPDKVFKFSDIESAVLIARRLPSGRSPIGKVTYKHVREGEIENFKKSYGVTNEYVADQSRFSEDNHWSFWIPDLDQLWKFTQDLPKFESIAEIGKGFEFRSHEDPKFLPNSITESDTWSLGLVEGFTRLRKYNQTHERPDTVWVNLDPTVIRRRGHGIRSGVPQVLLNHARVSRGPWRLKAFLDPDGHPVGSRFLVVRPLTESWSLEMLWAICNSPFANAYSYSFSRKRDVLPGLIRDMRVPALSDSDALALTNAVNTYLTSARNQAVNDSSQLQDKLRELHWRIDAHVLRLYDLPARLERQLLDLFDGATRRGVPFHQTRYFPAHFSDALTLQQLLSITAEWDVTNERRVHLIHKQLDASISPKEEEELHRLQDLADSRVRLVAPLPIIQLEAVKEDLKRRGIWEETNVVA